MKILITNHHLHEFTGTEISTLTLAKYLKKAKNNITVYAKYLHQDLTKSFKHLNIPVVNDLELIKNHKFDIIHIQHNICAFEIKKYFPNTPLIMWIHAISSYLEKPPFFDLNISKFLVNNKEAFNHLSKTGLQKNKIIVYRNIVDPEKFYQTKKINKKPKKALIISNKITKEKELLLKKVLNSLNIEYKFVGMRFEYIPNHELVKEINKVDIVFTVALGAMESMFCGRIPIIYDYNNAPYDDGMVTENNFEKLMKSNFSGRATKQIFKENDLVREIKKYDYKQSKIIKEKANKYYNANLQIKKIIKIYKDVIKKYKKRNNTKKEIILLSNIIDIVNTTKHYASSNTYKHSLTQIKNLENEIDNYKKTIKNKHLMFKNSKLYILYQMNNRLKNYLKKIFIKK